MKAGKLFEQEIRNSLKYIDNLWFMRIQDHSSYTHFMKKNVPIRIPKTPGDFFAVYDGIPVLLEAKSSKSAISYNVSGYIKDHQLEENRNVIAAGGRAWFLINKRNKPRESQVWYVTTQDIEDLQNEKRRKALKWEDFPIEREIKKVKAGIWDLQPLFI